MLTFSNLVQSSSQARMQAYNFVSLMGRTLKDNKRMALWVVLIRDDNSNLLFKLTILWSQWVRPIIQPQWKRGQVHLSQSRERFRGSWAEQLYSNVWILYPLTVCSAPGSSWQYWHGGQYFNNGLLANVHSSRGASPQWGTVNTPFSNSRGWTGSSMKWRLMRANLFKCKLICLH